MKLRPLGRSRAVVIAIEGADGVGKCTQACALSNRLREMGYESLTVSVPISGGEYYHDIYKMLEDGRARSHPHLFQAIQVANRLAWQNKYLERYLQELDCLVLDRWDASTYAYGMALEAEEGWIRLLSGPLIEPDLTIVLDGPCHREASRDAYEKDTLFQEEVRALYRAWVKKTTSAVVIDGTPSQMDVAKEVWSHVEGFFKRD